MKKVPFLLALCCACLWSTESASAPRVATAEYKAAAAAYERGDFASAARAFTALEAAGDTQARGALSLMYLQGRGVPRNIEASERLSISAAADGVPLAQFVQGLLNSQTAERTPNYTAAIKWFALAAEQGHGESQANLGAIYFAGQWVPQDVKLGLFWTQKAAEQGFPMAQENMGKVYLEGVGVRIDAKKALDWYSKAAIQGSAKALGWLGVMYVEGKALPLSRVNAYAYFDMAAKRGDEMGRANQARLRPQLSADELKKALELSSKWKVGSPLPSE